MFFDWSKSEEIDWSGRSGPLITEKDYENSVIKRILQNKYTAPFCEKQFVHVTPWWDPQDPHGKSCKKVLQNEVKRTRYNGYIPGLRPTPSYPQLSTLKQDQHQTVLRVLNAKHGNVQPRNFPKPKQKDYDNYEEIKELYEIEQNEFKKWARQLWIMGDCIRALRPKPTLERVYDAQFRIREAEMQSLPQNYTLAAQIPLQPNNSGFQLELKEDLINVDLEMLPVVDYPKEMTEELSILRECPLPELCIEHPCRFILPDETTVSVLPLSEIHRELAQYATEHRAGLIASEEALSCLLQTDRSWKIPVTVIECFTPDGDMKKAIVLGNEFSVQKECATQRTHKAYTHLLHHTFVPATEQYKKTQTKPTKAAEPNQQSHSQSLNDDLDVSSDDDDTNKLLIDDRETIKTEAMDTSDADNANIDATHEIETIKLDLYEVCDVDTPLYDSHFTEVDQMGTCYNNSGAKGKSKTNDTEINRLNQTINVTEIMQANSTRDSNADGSAKQPNVYKTKKRNIMVANLSNENDISSEDDDDSQPLSEIAKRKTSQWIESDKSCKTTHRNELETEESKCQHSVEECYQSSQLTTDISALSRDAINDIIGIHTCACKGTLFELPPPRSYGKWQVRDSATHAFDIVVHTSHKTRKGTKEVILEPIVEYQPELGGARLSAGRVRSLSLALMLRENASLINVRVDYENGHVIVVDEMNADQFAERHGDARADIAAALYTVCDQLRYLLPGQYILVHDSCHGSNAMLYSSKVSSRDAVTLSLRAETVNMPDAEEALHAKKPPELGPTLLPWHKHRASLPLAFTPYPSQLRQDKRAAAALARARLPPSALQWPKKKKKSKKSRLNRPTQSTE